MKDARFFLVWASANRRDRAAHVPNYSHENEADALSECQRLARAYPGKRFYVVEAISFTECEVSEPRHTLLPYPPLGILPRAKKEADDDDDLPF